MGILVVVSGIPASTLRIVRHAYNNVEGPVMTTDPTEPIRRQILTEINAAPGSREALEAQHGQVWSTEELSRDFDVISFADPLVVVTRKSDGVTGSLTFRAKPRFYIGFKAD